VEALLAVLDAQHQRILHLEQTVAKLSDEIARLQGQSPRPKIAPSRLEAPPKPSPAPGDKRPGSSKRSRIASFDAPVDVILSFPNPPPGSVSHGFEDYFVQELFLQTKGTRAAKHVLVTERKYVQPADSR